jgi:hypothetical protein
MLDIVRFSSSRSLALIVVAEWGSDGARAIAGTARLPAALCRRATAEPAMEIIRLPLGEAPPLDRDCLRIEQQADGSFALTATALCEDEGGDEDEDASASIVGGPTFPTVEAAEEAGLAWAREAGVEQLYIGTGTLSQPLALTEADLPGDSPVPSRAS